MAKIGSLNAYTPDSNRHLNTQRASGMPSIGENAGNLAVVSTNVDVYSNGIRVGFIQSASPSERRPITKIQELGTEGIVQVMPGNTNGGSLSIERFAIINNNLWNALGLTRTGQFIEASQFDTTNSTTLSAVGATYGNPFKTLKDQRVPLQIDIKTKMPDARVYIESYLDCWLESYSKQIQANNITISERASISYSDLVTTVA